MRWLVPRVRRTATGPLLRAHHSLFPPAINYLGTCPDRSPSRRQPGAAMKRRKQQGGIQGTPLPGGMPVMSSEAEAAVLRLARLLGRQMARDAFEARQRQDDRHDPDHDSEPLQP